MPDRHSVFPENHRTQGVADDDLRGLVARHSVSFELGPNQVVGPSGELLRRGWLVDLFGRQSAADAALPYGQVHHHVHDVLHAVAATLVPHDRRGVVNAALERFTGAVRLDPRRGFAEEVRLRIQLEPHTTARATMVGDSDTVWRDEIVEPRHPFGHEAPGVVGGDLRGGHARRRPGLPGQLRPARRRR